MKISVCVPTYNRSTQVRQLLENLSIQTSLPDEILLVDASDDVRTSRITEGFMAILPMLHHEPWEKGLTRQRNRAIDLATGDIVLFLDDDMILEPDFIERLNALFADDEDKNIAGLSGILLGELPPAPGIGWRLKRTLGVVESDVPGRLLACGETTPLPRPSQGELAQTDYLPGCLHAWRRDILQRYRFSTFFQGYGLGEDKYFSGSVGKQHRLFVSGDLHGSHLHVAGNRPDFFRWGYFNVFNHCFIMRECSVGRGKWLRFMAFHLFDALNDVISWVWLDRTKKRLSYGLGRLAGAFRCLVAPPRMHPDDPAQVNRLHTRIKRCKHV